MKLNKDITGKIVSSNNVAVNYEEREVSSTEIISVAEACKFLVIHRNTLYKLIGEGEIPAFRLTTGGRWKFKKSELEEWLENRQAKREL